MMRKIDILDILCSSNPLQHGKRFHFVVKFRCYRGIAGFIEFNVIYSGVESSGDATPQYLSRVYVVPVRAQHYSLDLYAEAVDVEKIPRDAWERGVIILSASYNGKEFKRICYACRHYYRPGTVPIVNNLECYIHTQMPFYTNVNINWNRRPVKISAIPNYEKPFNSPDPDSPYATAYAQRLYKNYNLTVVVVFADGEKIVINTKRPLDDNNAEISSIDTLGPMEQQQSHNLGLGLGLNLGPLSLPAGSEYALLEAEFQDIVSRMGLHNFQ